MQIREIALTELVTAYDVLKELRSIDYNEFENIVYEMRHIDYKMFGLFDGEELITYAGVNIQSNLYLKRHMFIFDLVTKSNRRGCGHGREMLLYLVDYARMFNCENIALSSGFQRLDAHRFYESEGFRKTGYTFYKTI